MPSCIRVPPDTGTATNGNPPRSPVPLHINRPAAATPIVPARKRNSLATTATRRPRTMPSR